MERRFIERHVELRAEPEDGAQPTIEGYGAVYYDGTPATEYVLWPGVVERIMAGAFDRAVREDDVRSLFNHNPDFVLGRRRPGGDAQTLSLSVDATGLRYAVRPPSTRGDVVEAVRRGDVSGSSFMFSAESVWREIENEDGSVLTIREIVGVTLYEVGPVTFPAYEQTTAGVRSAERRSIEQELAEWRKARAAVQLGRRARRLRLIELEAGI